MSDRATYLTQSGYRLLDDWGVGLRRMFPAEVAYLVGSALTTSDYRDVDVRLMLDDDAHKALASVVNLADLDLSVSLWGQQVTGLPIDFQVQRTTEANAEHKGRRHPLGLLSLVDGKPSVPLHAGESA
jgi:hypothetical protein